MLLCSDHDHMILFVSLILLSALLVNGLYTGEFLPTKSWVNHHQQTPHPNEFVSFIVALNLRNVDSMKEEFLRVSDPKSPSYGRFLSKSVNLLYTFVAHLSAELISVIIIYQVWKTFESSTVQAILIGRK
jgi:hypothetical protein